MKLSDLLSVIKYNIVSGCAEATDISDITTDSRRAWSNLLFVCIKGVTADGHKYAESAYDNGCRAFLAEHELELPSDATVAVTENTREALADISAKFFDYPAKKLKLVGITGTKGKTTSAIMLRHAMITCGLPTGYIGTCGIFLNDRIIPTANTTPESLEMQRHLAAMVDEGDKYAVIEVSSQALKMGRTRGIDFDVCVFTNLSRDHIGGFEHADFEEYRECKHKLFTEHNAKAIIYNADDPAHEYMLKDTNADRYISVSANPDFSADYNASKYFGWRDGSQLGIKFTCTANGKKTAVTLPFVGRFSMFNAMNAIAVCEHFGISPEQTAKALENVSVSGRFEIISLKSKPNTTFIIDYAHNGMSLESILKSVRPYTERGKVICVVGSVGNRTYERRAELGSVACELADFSIITSDNPNFEPPENICADIAKAFGDKTDKYTIITDREAAVGYAVDISKSGDIVVFAGKGHEEYQLVNGKKLEFSEKKILKYYDFLKSHK